jgi:hypothetical protein
VSADQVHELRDPEQAPQRVDGPDEQNARAKQRLAPEMVALYRTPAQVLGKYVEGALLYSDGATGLTNEAGMLKSMRTKAGALGANGVILDGISDPSAVVKVIASVLCVGAERKGWAIATFVQPAATDP